MQELRSFSGARLRRARHQKGWTQAELAWRTGFRERQIIRWENNQNAPRLAAVDALARELGVKIDELFSGSAESSGRGGTLWGHA